MLSSPEEFQTFMETSVYKDFLSELDIRVEELLRLLTDEDLEYTGRDYDLFRGGVKNLNQMKVIFEDLKHNAEIEITNGRMKDED